MAVTPSNPEQEGSVGVEHDGRPDASHQAEVDKADKGGEKISKEDRGEGSGESTAEEREESEEEE